MGGNWWVAICGWQLVGDNLLVTIGWWQLVGGNWWVAVGRWQLVGGSLLVAVCWWQLVGGQREAGGGGGRRSGYIPNYKQLLYFE